MKNERDPPHLKSGLWVCPACCCLAAVTRSRRRGNTLTSALTIFTLRLSSNKTAEAEVENYMRTAFIDQVIQSNRFKTVPTLEQADAVINGNVISLTTAALSYRNNILAAEERMTITLEASFREKESGKTIWSSQNVVGTTDYKLQDNVDPQPARRQALAKLAKDTAENAFNMMMSDF